MPSVLEILRQDHENLARLLSLFERELDRIEGAVVPEYDIMWSILGYCASFPDRFHHPLEDRVLACLRKRNPAAVQPMGDLRKLHEALAAQTQAVWAAVGRARQRRAVPSAELLEAGRTFVQTYREHMRLEDEHFFPAAEQSLAPKDWADIEAIWLDPFDPVFTARADAHYRRLRRALLSTEDEPDAC